MANPFSQLNLSARIRGALDGFRSPMSVRPIYDPNATASWLSPEMPADPRARYKLLELQRDNAIYKLLASELRGVINPTDYAKIRTLESPALEAVVFHAMHVFPGSLAEALPLDLPPESLLKLAAERVMRWSWFGTQKDRLVDTSATFGDAFLKAWSSESRVGMEVRHPADVTEFEEDREGNIVYIRLDVELADEDGNPLYHTEAWSSQEDLYGRWLHRLGLHAKYSELPSDDTAKASGAYVEARITDFGYDFVPFVRAPFGTGFAPSERSSGVFERHREAIDDHLRSYTVLRDRYFRHGKPLWQSVTAQEKPVDYIEEMARQQSDSENREVEGARFPDEEMFIRNPKGTRLEALVPNIDWSAGLAQIDDSRRALERSMPELRFFRGHDTGDPSAAAMEKHLAPAVRRARAARGNYEEAITKALKMCLSMGQSRRLFGSDIGSYAAGDFDALTFTPRPIIPDSEAVKIVTESSRAEMYAALKDVSPELLRLRLVEDGYEEDEAERIATTATPVSTLSSLLGGDLDIP